MGGKKIDKNEELEIIRLHKEGMNTVQIGKKLNRNDCTIGRVLKRNGIDNRYKTQYPLSSEDKKIIRHEYLNNYNNCQVIWENFFKHTHPKTAIEHYVKNAGMSRGAGRGSYNPNVHHSYFSHIDTPEKAYILGYIMADGSINKLKKTLRLECVDRDQEIIEFITQEVSPLSPIKYYERKDRSLRTAYSYIYSVDIVKDLSNYGIVPNKQSQDIGLPKINRNLYNNYLRGYFDGDGTVWINKNLIQVSLCTTQKFGEDLINLLKQNMVITKPKNNLINMKDYGSDIHHLRITRTYDVRAFFNYIYNDNTFRLDRKYNKFINLISTTESKSKLIPR